MYLSPARTSRVALKPAVSSFPHALMTQQAHADSAESIRANFERYAPMVYRRALRILGNPDDAQDMTQEVFIRAFEKAEQFEQRSQISTWLYRITTNLCLNRIRDSKRRRLIQTEQIKPMQELRASGTMPSDALITVHQMLKKVDPTCAQAAIYTYVDGMSYEETASLLGVSRRTVSNLLSRFQQEAIAHLGPASGQPKHAHEKGGES